MQQRCGAAGADDDVDPFTATAIAADVRAGRRQPGEVVRIALDRIGHRNPELLAFVTVRVERALAEAEALARHPDLAVLPLAGVPIAIKDNIPVAGEVMRAGSLAGDPAPSPTDHPVVQRLRAAGAIVVGLTAVCELWAWAATDSPGRVTRNPWNPDRIPGGSSGGSAAAVAAGMVPVAHGNDGLGSIRVPAACCGLIGVKPGRGVVPAQVGPNSWHGMVENGVLATTVADAALVLSVMAADPSLARPAPPGKLHIGVSTSTPTPLVRLDPQWARAARTAGAVLGAIGHTITPTTMRFSGVPLAGMTRWLAHSAEDIDGLDRALVQPRNRRHASLGRVVQRLGLVRQSDLDAIETEMRRLFERFDLLITPMLAHPPFAAASWSERSWAGNVVASLRFTPLAPVWNLLGWPAASVPMGIHTESHTPVAAQIVGPPGSEARILAVAEQIEHRHPWLRRAPQHLPV